MTFAELYVICFIITVIELSILRYFYRYKPITLGDLVNIIIILTIAPLSAFFVGIAVLAEWVDRVDWNEPLFK